MPPRPHRSRRGRGGAIEEIRDVRAQWLVSGGRARKFVAALVENLGFAHFDFLFFAYDEYPWTQEPWYRAEAVTVKAVPGGRKWTLYFDHLRPEAVAARAEINQ